MNGEQRTDLDDLPEDDPLAALPRWFHDSPPWWYHPERATDAFTQGLAWACARRLERMEYWNCEALRAGFFSDDGYIPGVVWNPDGYPQHRMSFIRALIVIRQAYNDVERANRFPAGSSERECLIREARTSLETMARLLGKTRTQAHPERKVS